MAILSPHARKVANMLGREATMILYFANDLVWATRIKRTAEADGIACRPVREQVCTNCMQGSVVYDECNLEW